VLRSQGQRGNYRMLDAGVLDAAFKAGPKGFETVNAVARQSGWEHSDDQDGHFGGRGGRIFVAAR
jgi:hypothetical protein